MIILLRTSKVLKWHSSSQDVLDMTKQLTDYPMQSAGLPLSLLE